MKPVRYLAALMTLGTLILFFGCTLNNAGKPVSGDQAETSVYTKPGFYTEVHDGRLWVFREGSKDLEDFRSHGELAKHVIRPGAGPGGITLKGPDAETLDDYMAAH